MSISLSLKPSKFLFLLKLRNFNHSEQESIILFNLRFIFSVPNGKHVPDDDIIFEEFARIRLKGHDPDDTDV